MTALTLLPSAMRPEGEPEYYRLSYQKSKRVTAEKIVTVTNAEQLRAEIAQLGPRYAGAEKMRAHECSICHQTGPWTTEWIWFGSYRDMDDGKPLLKMCSEECRHTAIGSGLISEDSEIEDDES